MDLAGQKIIGLIIKKQVWSLLFVNEQHFAIITYGEVRLGEVGTFDTGLPRAYNNTC